MKLVNVSLTVGMILLWLGGCKSKENSISLNMNNLEKLKAQLIQHSYSQDSSAKTEALSFLEKVDPTIQGYSMDMNAINGLKEKLPAISNLGIKIYGGNWCSDTHEGVPSLLKVLDNIGFDPKHMEYHYVSRDKSQVDGTPATFKINSVPWVLIYNGDKLIGEIVEFPRTTWEGDLLKILNN